MGIEGTLGCLWAQIFGAGEKLIAQANAWRQSVAYQTPLLSKVGQRDVMFRKIHIKEAV